MVVEHWIKEDFKKIFFFTLHFFFKFLKTFYKCILPMGFLPGEIQVAFPRESQLWQSHTTQPTAHTGRFCVFIIHRTLGWTTGSLTCAQMLMHVITQWCTDTERESARKVDSGKKSFAAPGNQACQQHGSLMLYQLSPDVTPSNWPGSKHQLTN